MNRAVNSIWRMPSIPRKCEGRLDCACHACVKFFQPVSKLNTLNKDCPMGHSVSTNHKTAYQEHFDSGGIKARNQALTAVTYNPLYYKILDEGPKIVALKRGLGKGRGSYNTSWDFSLVKY